MTNVKCGLLFFASEADFVRWYHAALLNLTLTGGNALGYQFARRNQKGVSGLKARHSDEQYIALIERAKHEISAGNVYQLCLTNQITASHELDPLNVFYRLRKINPAPYAGILESAISHW